MVSTRHFLFIFNFLYHNSHDKFDRQIIVSNQINQIESLRKHRCCAWVQKRVCYHQGLNSWPRAWASVPIFRVKCDTTQLFRRPFIFSFRENLNWRKKEKSIDSFCPPHYFKCFKFCKFLPRKNVKGCRYLVHFTFKEGGRETSVWRNK